MLKHRVVSTKADKVNPNGRIQASEWGSTATDYDTAPTHVFSGGAHGSIWTRDTGVQVGGAWIAAAAGVLQAAGAGQAPAFTQTPTVAEMAPGDTSGLYAGTRTLVRVFQPALAAGGQAVGRNVFVGGAGNSTLSNGASADTSRASNNVGVGWDALLFLTTGASNVGVGYQAGKAISTGIANTALGTAALSFASTGGYNTAIGNNALVAVVSGNFNTAIGEEALKSTTGSNNVGLGYLAGAYETGSNAFYVDNQNRTNTAGDKAGALLYGVFNATPANQTLKINATVTVAQGMAVTGTLSGLSSFTRTVMSGTLTLTSSSSSYQFVDLNGSDRDLVLPTAASGMAFTVHHFGGANTLTVKDSAAATVTTLTTGQTKTVFYDGTIWQVM